MAERALQACLVTLERPAFELKLGIHTAQCGEPPFDSATPSLRLWRWPWTEWPSYNQAVFERDLERILRWYRARGFYEARVVKTIHDPPEATAPGSPGPCDPDREDCFVQVVVIVEEGQPVTVAGIELRGTSKLDASLKAELQRELEPLRAARFDEASYSRSKQALRTLLKAHGYAGAEVDGRARIHTASYRANLEFELRPGPRFNFGSLRVLGNGSLPESTIRAAAGLPGGAPYDPEVLNEVQAEVFALGAFSAVEIEEELDSNARLVHVVVRVTPLVPDQLRVGVGVLSGASRRTDTGDLVSIPQWDVHLFGNYERRHVVGTLGRLRIEERPRLIYKDSFPAFTEPAFGNIVSVRLNQPGLIEARTDAFTTSSWDYGPDPFLGFNRSDVLARVGLRRGFFARRLVATLALQQDVFLVPDRATNVTSDGSETPTPYEYGFLEQDVRVDLRDSRLRPTLGAYFGLNATESPRSATSDWTMFRFAPEARGYLPLPLDAVFAARFAIGAIFIQSSNASLDAISRQLGPTSYRLRGGGANSNRGFLPGQLGAGIQGGLRRWEANAELRFALGESFGVVGFLDFGDVNDSPVYRFDDLNTSAGFGFRYHTVIGVLRLDAGFRIPTWQRVDGSDGIEDDAHTLPWSSTPGAVHFTIGESF